MSMNQNEINIIGATRISVGLSQVIRIQGSANQYSTALKYGSGGSLEIVAPQLSGTSTSVGTSNAWSTGYLLATTEVMSWDGNATIYLAATGATAVAHVTIGYTSGMTFL